MSNQYVDLQESNLLTGGYPTSHGVINSASVNANYGWMQLFANLFGCAYNVNPRYILAIAAMESNYSYDDPMQVGNNAPYMTSMDEGTNLLVNSKMAAYSDVPTFLSAYNGSCSYTLQNGQFMPYGASAAYLALQQNFSGYIYTNFVGYMPTLESATCVTLINTCYPNSTCTPCGDGSDTLSCIGTVVSC
ncbi:MAG: hypothetical protein ACYCVB_05945 [Bacilli bacterium]